MRVTHRRTDTLPAYGCLAERRKQPILSTNRWCNPSLNTKQNSPACVAHRQGCLTFRYPFGAKHVPFRIEILIPMQHNAPSRMKRKENKTVKCGIATARSLFAALYKPTKPHKPGKIKAFRLLCIKRYTIPSYANLYRFGERLVKEKRQRVARALLTRSSL